jgi:hypothetical protein
LAADGDRLLEMALRVVEAAEVQRHPSRRRRAAAPARRAARESALARAAPRSSRSSAESVPTETVSSTSPLRKSSSMKSVTPSDLRARLLGAVALAAGALALRRPQASGRLTSPMSISAMAATSTRCRRTNLPRR